MNAVGGQYRSAWVQTTHMLWNFSFFSPGMVHVVNHFRLAGDSPLTSMGMELNRKQLSEEDTAKGSSNCFHFI